MKWNEINCRVMEGRATHW